MLDIKRTENELYWEALEKDCLGRKFFLRDIDFSDLYGDSDDEVPLPSGKVGGIPPPPPPGMMPLAGAPPPPPAAFALNIPAPPKTSEASNHSDSSSIKKSKKTMKLFWKEIQENPIPIHLRDKVGGFFWDEIPYVEVDTKVLEYLFETKTNDLIIKVN